MAQQFVGPHRELERQFHASGAGNNRVVRKCRGYPGAHYASGHSGPAAGCAGGTFCVTHNPQAYHFIPPGNTPVTARRVREAHFRSSTEQEGIDALRLDGVARAVGCSRSSLYRYFDTKETLILAVLEKRVTAMAQRMHIELEAVSEPADRLVMGIVRAVELAQSDPQFTALFCEPNSPTVIRIAGTALPQLLQPVVVELLPLVANGGLLPADVPTEEAARWVVMIEVGLLTFDSSRAADRDALVLYLERFLIPSLTGAGTWRREPR